MLDFLKKQKTEDEQKAAPISSKSMKNTACYNLIILDESGSMCGVTNLTISGCNETLNTIRMAAKKDASTKQYVSIYCFDTNLNLSRYIMENTPIETVNDITTADYRPNGNTPLNDAIGFTCTRLHTLLDTHTDASAVVTIITDGYENSSREYTFDAVKKMIELYKEEGWVFTFIGANIDAKATASSYSITSSIQFTQTEAGMRNMWQKERSSRDIYFEKMRRMKMAHYDSEMDRKKAMARLNEGYFDEFSRVTPNHINTLKNNEVFVFGSNLAGEHIGGAAHFAHQRFGAIWGQGVGLQGQSYAIPTMQGGVDTIKPYVDEFIKFANAHAELNFFVTAIGCGIAGFTPEQIAPLFKDAVSLPNVALPKSFWKKLNVQI